MSDVDDVDGSSAPLIEHLKELRTRVMYSLLAFAACFCIAYYVSDELFLMLSKPLCTALASRMQECNLVLISPQEGFFVAIKIATWGGFALAFPVVGYHKQLPTWIGGKTAELGAQVLASTKFQGSADAFLSLSMKFIMAFGLCFQLPVLLTLMGKAGIISSAGLRATRKYAVIAILAIAAIVTPPDVVSQLILFLAIYPLYEVSIWMIARFERDREARERADGTWVEPDEDDE